MLSFYTFPVGKSTALPGAFQAWEFCLEQGFANYGADALGKQLVGDISTNGFQAWEFCLEQGFANYGTDALGKQLVGNVTTKEQADPTR